MVDADRLDAGQYVAECRNRAGLTQQQAADRWGKSRVTLARVETNEARIKQSELLSLAEAVHADPERLAILAGFMPKLGDMQEAKEIQSLLRNVPVEKRPAFMRLVRVAAESMAM